MLTASHGLRLQAPRVLECSVRGQSEFRNVAHFRAHGCTCKGPCGRMPSKRVTLKVSVLFQLATGSAWIVTRARLGCAAICSQRLV
jgi:hypothetical protein